MSKPTAAALDAHPCAIRAIASRLLHRARAPGITSVCAYVLRLAPIDTAKSSSLRGTVRKNASDACSTTLYAFQGRHSDNAIVGRVLCVARILFLAGLQWL